MKKSQNLSRDDIMKMFAETDRQMKETDRQLKETGRFIKETGRQMKESDRKLKEELARSKKESKEELARNKKESKEESDRWIKKIRAESALRIKEIKESRQEFKEYVKERKEKDKIMGEYLKELGREVGGIAHSNGEMAEEYFYTAFKKNMTFVNESFDTIKKNLSYNNGTLEAEFDLVLFNGKSAALIEIKYNAKPDNIEIERLISRVEVFRILFPQYAHYNIYLGVAAMSFKKDLVWRLHRAGIVPIRPVGKKMVVYDRNVKVF